MHPVLSRRFRDFYAGWLTLRHVTAARAGTRVAYAGTNIPYYLLGQGLRNEVRYINIDAAPRLAAARLPPRGPERTVREPGRIPGRAGIGSGPIIGRGSATSMPRGSSSWSSPASIPPRARTTWPTPRDSRSRRQWADSHPERFATALRPGRTRPMVPALPGHPPAERIMTRPGGTALRRRTSSICRISRFSHGIGRGTPLIRVRR